MIGRLFSERNPHRLFKPGTSLREIFPYIFLFLIVPVLTFTTLKLCASLSGDEPFFPFFDEQFREEVRTRPGGLYVGLTVAGWVFCFLFCLLFSILDAIMDVVRAFRSASKME